MLSPIRAVSPVVRPRCPECHCFVRLDAGTCTACGLPFALASETRSAKTDTLHRPVESVGFQSGPKGNAHFSNLQPDGKVRKQKKQLPPTDQMNLFQGVL